MKLIKAILPVLLAITAPSVSAQSAISKKYDHKIVFSKSEIVPGHESEAAFITEYKPGDPLYYRLYMDSTIKQMIDKWRYSNSPAARFKHLYVKFYIDDKYTAGYVLDQSSLSDAEFLATSNFGSVMSGATGSDVYRLDDKFTEFMGTNADKLNGKHKVMIEVFMYDKSHVYERYGTGTLTINGEGGNVGTATAGITNAFHKAHLRKLVFGSQPLGADLSDKDVITDYTVGQPLYYRVFMDNTLKSYILKHFGKTYDLSYFKNMYVKFYLDGQFMEMGSMNSSATLDFSNEEKAAITTFGGSVALAKPGDGGKQTIYYVLEKFLFKYNKQLSGTHKVKMELYLYSQGLNQTIELLGDGEFTMHLNSISPNNPQWCYKPTAAVSDPDLEAKMIKAYNDYSKEPCAKKVWLKFANWEINKNELTGAILSKYRNATVLVESKGSCFYNEVTFVMDYEGNGKYGYLHFSGLVPGSYHPILCECLK